MTLDDIEGVLVVGAGSMGSQIAMQAALHGYRVTLNDLTAELLEKAMQGNREQLARRVAKGQMTQAQMDEAVARIRLETDLDRAARDADLYYLLEEGVAAFPFKLADFSGLDIGYNARLETYQVTGDPKDAPPKALEARVTRGQLGRKTGKGFYDWSTTPPTPTTD